MRKRAGLLTDANTLAVMGTSVPTFISPHDTHNHIVDIRVSEIVSVQSTAITMCDGSRSIIRLRSGDRFNVRESRAAIMDVIR